MILPTSAILEFLTGNIVKSRFEMTQDTISLLLTLFIDFLLTLFILFIDTLLYDTLLFLRV